MSEIPAVVLGEAHGKSIWIHRVGLLDQVAKFEHVSLVAEQLVILGPLQNKKPVIGQDLRSLGCEVVARLSPGDQP